MKRLILTVPLIFTVSFPLFAQAQTPNGSPKCLLTVEQSPEVRGLKLNQPFQVLKRMFGDENSIIGFRDFVHHKPDELDHRGVYLTRTYLHQSDERLTGLDSLSLDYIDEKLASITFTIVPQSNGRAVCTSLPQ